MRICFDLHTIITHSYPKHKIYFIKSTSSISPNTTKILHIQQYLSLFSSSPQESMCRPPHPHHSSLPKKIHFASSSPHQTSRRLPPQSCTYKQLNEPIFLKRLCFNPHTTITHPCQKHESCFINPHQPSHSRWFTTKIVYLQKQNDTTLLVSSLNYVTTLNTIITHPYPKSEDASFFKKCTNVIKDRWWLIGELKNLALISDVGDRDRQCGNKNNLYVKEITKLIGLIKIKETPCVWERKRSTWSSWYPRYNSWHSYILSYGYMWDTIHYITYILFPLQTFGLIVSKKHPKRTLVIDIINHLTTCKK